MATTYTYKPMYIWHETEKAIFVSAFPDAPRNEQVCLPKSQIEYDDGWKRGDCIDIKIPDWLIEKNNL